MSESGVQEACKTVTTRENDSNKQQENKCSSLYVFPAVSTGSSLMRTQPSSYHQSNQMEMEEQVRSPPKPVTAPEPRAILTKTHARSASHGGVLASSSSAGTGGIMSVTSSSVVGGVATGNFGGIGQSGVGTTAQRPSSLKKPGHQRAFSHGQVVDMTTGQPVTGHSRVGSKTDFILPPGHRDDPRPVFVGKTPSFRGHSRQASRSESIYTIRRSAASPWWRRAWAHCFGSAPEEPNVRTIMPNHLISPKIPASRHPNGNNIDNRIRTTKYTMLTFLPRNLLEQFHRVANLYFIFIVLLNWVPAINAFGKEIAMIPVTFVLGVTALKDFFEDRRRLNSDKRVNNSTCRVYVRNGDRYVRKPWKDVKVGDLVHLSNNELVPADLLLLRTSDPQGFAYLDTCNLDGETNLKQRQVVRGFLEFQDSFQPSLFHSLIEVDKPSTKIYRFHGAVVHPTGTRVNVSTENLLLRGCLLKNTDFIEGIVVYAGHETKAMLNNGGPRYKRSRLEQQMNIDVVWCVVILVVLCIVGAAGCRFWLSSYTHIYNNYTQDTIGPVPFLTSLQDPSVEGMLTFWTFVIILQVMIPLSLYVTIEMAKLGQVYHIMSDKFLYDNETDRRIECRALNITEELGQVQYIFSDKTGTLTENKMVFRRCAVGGQDYVHTGEGENLLACTRLKEDLLIGTYRHRLQEFLILLAICNTVVVNTHPHHDTMNSSGVIEEPQNNAKDPTRYFFQKYIRLTESKNVNNPAPMNKTTTPTTSATPNNTPETYSPISTTASETEDSSVLRSRLLRPRLLNLQANLSMLTRRLSPLGQRNNSPHPMADKNGKSLIDNNVPAIYEAESPDELALVQASRAYGVKLIRRTAQSAIVSLPDKSTLTFEILKILPFDSSRKCMSVIVKHPHTGEVVLYCKGADTTIFSALKPNEEELIVTTKIKQQLLSYARQGLRTLVTARRSLTVQEYESWLQKHMTIELTTENRERRIRDSYSSLETQLTLLGVTGIEDKLQAGVPEAMTALMDAGIVIWVLTGDKPETAVNIAYSAGLFTPAMQLLRLQARSKSVAETLIHSFLEAIQRENVTNNALQSQVKGKYRSNHDSLRRRDLDSAERVAYRIGSTWQRQRALVVDGKTLTFILDPRSGLTAPFLELTRACSSVLACRATPLQKAYIVKVVKEQLQMRTLAIGDGANDVSMIQTADVGIGLSGQEGTQAVMAADFAITRFPMLTRLLLVHGHWCYDRLSRMILYFFYKNATFVFLIFWYQLYCGFSGAVMIDQIYLMLYNLFFTSLPPLVLGIYNQVAPANLLMSHPRLYERGRLALVYQPHSFWITIADALFQSIVIFFLCEAAYYDSDVDIWEFGTTITTSCLFAMLVQACVEFSLWTIIHIGAIIASVIIYFSFCIFYNAVCVNCMGLPGSYWVIQTAILRHIFWATVILSSILAVLPRMVYRALKNTLAPDEIQYETSRYMRRTRHLSKNKKNSNRKTSLIASWSRRNKEDATIRSRNCSSKNNTLTTIVA